MNIQTLKGFRDFLPAEKRKRDFVEEKIKEVFEKFGFEPLETPALEYAELLLGKYGEEADKLVYSFMDRGERNIALRYDQTVPTARVLSQYAAVLPRYFRRYQMQNVYRAEKPQKGRYRELMQCDVDIFGTTSTVADAEIVSCIYSVYKNIGFINVKININDRQVLFDTFNPFSTEIISVFSIIQSVDKLDKIGREGVSAELVKKGMLEEQAGALLEAVKAAQMSIRLTDIIDKTVALGVPRDCVVFNPALARGLDYYTGMIFEVTIPEYGAGSVAGGGRYDKLISQLGGADVPAVGVAIGFDRTVEAASALGLISETDFGLRVMVALISEETETEALMTASTLRSRGICVEVYPSVEKFDKQIKTAVAKNMKYLLIIGEEEAKSNKVSVKNLIDRSQSLVSADELVSFLQDGDRV